MREPKPKDWWNCAGHLYIPGGSVRLAPFMENVLTVRINLSDYMKVFNFPHPLV